MKKTAIPFTFSIPKEKIVSEIPLKKKFLSTLIPGKLDTYIYNTEKALTVKRSIIKCSLFYF
jgi:hypothetical protein